MDEALEFIQKLNATDSKYNYRLPTEAEWEYSVRAGPDPWHDTIYSHGNNPRELGAYAWYYANSGKQTHDVASLKPNANGLYDMHGNVWEWTQDRWISDDMRFAVEPTEPSFEMHRVLRGGSIEDSQYSLSSSSFMFLQQSDRRYHTGFRLVRTPQ